MRNSFGEHELDFDRCTACGQCIDVCVGEAVRIIGEPRTVGEVMEVVLRDRAYYGKSGGGLTLSGGEPMAQFEFSLSLLKAARSQGIHTCVETSGAANWRKYEQVLPWTDLFLFDYKATKPASHQELVGCSNAPLLQNLDRLIGAGAQVILRCPMVPGVNVTPDHLRGIAKLSAKYPQLVGIEIMPYHNLGVSKAERIGVERKLPPIESPTKALQDEWLHRLHGLGCPAARIG